MAVPAHLLQQLPARVGALLKTGEEELEPLARARSQGDPQVEGCEAGLPLGLSAFDQSLPDKGLPRGTVVELAVAGGAASATSIALAACRSAQREGQLHGGEVPWCAFIDPGEALHAPGVARAGVLLERLLVVRPPLDELPRVALRVAEARAFSVVVIDTMGVPGSSVQVKLGNWPRIVRRLSLAFENTSGCALLITDAGARRPLTLPVAMRLELQQPAVGQLLVRVAKERRGRVSSPRSVAWDRPRVGFDVAHPGWAPRKGGVASGVKVDP